MVARMKMVRSGIDLRDLRLMPRIRVILLGSGKPPSVEDEGVTSGVAAKYPSVEVNV